MKIPFIDIHAAHGPIQAELEAAVKEVLVKGNFVLGDPVGALEKRMAEYVGVPHGIGVASGTDALIIALRALHIGPGDAVITTPFSFIATSESIHAVGARPIFCDIDAGTYNLDAGKVREFIEKECRVEGGRVIVPTGETLKALLPVHIFGQAARMDLFMEMGEKWNLAIVEDAAQATGAKARVGGALKQVGSIGDVGCFSFYPSKNLGGAGDGGMILTRREDVADRVKLLHLHGSKQKYHHIEFGYNSRLDSIQAAVLGVKLSHLDAWLEARLRGAAAYRTAFEAAAKEKGVAVVDSIRLRKEGLPAGATIVLPGEDPQTPHTYNSFDIRVPKRDDFMALSQKEQVGSMIYYPVPLHLQSVYGFLGYKPESLPVAEAVAGDILAVPFYPGIPEEYIRHVAGLVAGHAASAGA